MRPPDAGRGQVLLGAHLDSVSAGPGLNDNGSGVAAVLDAAERLGADGTPPAGVSFAFWAAEELGLVGSRRFVARMDRRARESIRAYVNLDMVGSPRARPTVYAAGPDATARRLERLPRDGLHDQNVRARARELPSASDHTPFGRAGIPLGGLFTGAGHLADPCYHRACDDLHNVDARMTQAMANAARRAVERLASQPPGS